MIRGIRKYSTAGLIGLLLLAAASCGGQHKAPANGICGGTGVGSAAVPAVIASTPTTLQDALAQLDALEKPEGIDTALWNDLKGALREALACRAGTCAPPSGDSGKAVHGGPHVAALQRIVSSPPTGPANKINDLTATRETNGDFTLSWHYRNLGDYDQNGSVGVSDITPLAQHFGETYDAQTESDSLQAVVDGSGNAKIGVEDVTQIAQNFGVAVTKYSVRGSDVYAGPFAETAIIGVSPQVSDARKVLTTNIGASPLGYWQVVPQDAEDAQGEPSNIAGISLQIRSVTPTEVKEGTVVTFSAEVLGAGPFTYEWDFGGQAVPATSTEASPEVVLTRDIGGFPARLTVTNHLGNSAYPFTLTKLAREWKWEVLRSDRSFSKFQLATFNNEITAFVGASDFFIAGAAYLYRGTPGDWQIEELANHNDEVMALDSQSNPGLLGYYGQSYLSADLCFSGKTPGGWVKETVQASPNAHPGLFTFMQDDSPLAVFMCHTDGGIGGDSELRYALRDGDSWFGSVIDEGETPTTHFELERSMARSEDGTIGVCYKTWGEAETGKLKYAQWNPDTESFDVEAVMETQPDSSVGDHAKLSFDKDNNPTIACFTIGSDSNSDGLFPCYLQYIRRDESAWLMETARNCESDFPDASIPYRINCISHDVLGEPIIGYLSQITLEPHLIWRNAGIWEDCTLPDEIAAKYPMEIVYTDEGTPFVLFQNSGVNTDVILARYE